MGTLLGESFLEFHSIASSKNAWGWMFRMGVVEDLG